MGVLEAFAVYTVGFIARPIGTAIFGHYGDRVGRKAALIATLLLTGLATFAVGFVPTYSSVGIWGAHSRREGDCGSSPRMASERLRSPQPLLL